MKEDDLFNYIPKDAFEEMMARVAKDSLERNMDIYMQAYDKKDKKKKGKGKPPKKK